MAVDFLCEAFLFSEINPKGGTMKAETGVLAGIFLLATGVILHPMTAFGEAEVTLSGAVVTYNVPENETYVLNDPFPADASTVVKTGAGTLEVGVGNPERTGLIIDIRQGYVKTAVNKTAFGAGDTVKVTSGAALWFTGQNRDENLYNTMFGTVEISGAGPDGKGAFYRTGGFGPDYVIGTLKVMDGATVGGDNRCGARITYLNGNTLTNAVTGNNGVFIYRYFGDWFWSTTKVCGPGNIVQKSSIVIFQGYKSEHWEDVGVTDIWRFGTTSLMSLSANTYLPFSMRLSGDATVSLDGSGLNIAGSIIGDGAGRPKLTLTSSKAPDPVTLDVGGSISNVSLTVDKGNISLRMENSDLQCVLGSLGGSSLEVTGGESHEILRQWCIAKLYDGSRLSFTDAGVISMPNAIVACANGNFARNGLISRFEISGDTSMALTSSSFPAPGVYVGSVFSDPNVGTTESGWGVMSIRDGAVVTNGFVTGSSGTGALYLTDSVLYQKGRNAVVGGGNSGYGYLYASNAVITFKYSLSLAEGAGTTGHYVQFGGKTAHNASAAVVGGAGNANFYIGDGGRYDMRSTYEDPNGTAFFWLGKNSGESGVSESVFTCDNCSTCEVGRIHTLASSNHVSYMNLNRGSQLVVGQMWYSADHSRADNSRFLLSFNGGSLKYLISYGSQEDFLEDAPDRIIVHSLGGEIVLPENNWMRCDVPLERATGKSIKAVHPPRDLDFLAATNIGPARIVFEGAGEGATAFFAFDDGKGMLGNAIITSPGTGYDDDTVAYVVIPQYPDRRFTCGVELASETGGDFIKSGAGSLTLGCTNTYAGATVVRGGTLIAGCDWSIPSNSVLRMTDGAMDCANKVMALECVEGSGGEIRNVAGNVLEVERLSIAGADGVSFPDGMKMSVGGAWKVSSGDLASMKSAGKTPRYPCSVEFTDEATIEFDGTEFLSRDMSPYPICAFDNGKRTGTPRLVNPETLEPCWRFSVSGGMLSLKYRQPFAVILR